LGSTAFAQTSKVCPNSDICYQLNIPSDTASSGNGDIFFQLSAPTSYSWVALGQGDQMAGSNIFVMYTSSSGNNVTLSPRLGTGHNQPKYDGDAQVYLLDGSGVTNGQMVANVRCSNCQSWSGGSMDFTQTSAKWIYASYEGDALNSDDTGESISQHNGDYGPFTWQMASAKGGNSVNPFTDSSSSGTTASSAGGASATSSCGEFSNYSKMIIAHGVLASLAFVIFFPAGAISIRLFSFPGLIWFHAAMQAFAYVVYIAAFGIGVYLATTFEMIDEYHPIIGIVLFVLLFFQPFLGLLHHVLFKKHSMRTFWSYAHIWLGRILITLGIINGGLGLLFAADTPWAASNSAYIAYGVVAGVIWLVYVAAAVYGEVKRKKSQPPAYAPRKGSSGSPSGSGDQGREFYKPGR
ncbi:iron reductase domain protein, partial [Saccharata proteae CBS 121410]